VVLLTYAPGEHLYTSQGHAALWLSGGHYKSHGRAFNWGSFDSEQDGILIEFLRGGMQFHLSDYLYSETISRAKREKRRLVAQRLNLPPDRAREVVARVGQNTRKQNRYYTYHWAEANCSTRPRDLLDEVVGGDLKAQTSDLVPWTARREGLRNLAHWPTMWFAFNFASGPYVDRPITRWDSMMVPERLMEELARATSHSIWEDHQPRPLVAETCVLLEGEYDFPGPEPLARWFLPMGISGLFAAYIAWGPRLLAASAATDMFGLAAGGLGLVTMGLWAVSTLDGVGPTINWFWANPLALGLVAVGTQLGEGRLRPWGWRLSQALLGIALLGLLLSPLLSATRDHYLMALVWIPGLAAITWRCHQVRRATGAV
jgi:hypothetical protein